MNIKTLKLLFLIIISNTALAQDGFKSFNKEGQQYKVISLFPQGSKLDSGNYIQLQVRTLKNEEELNNSIKRGGAQLLKLNNSPETNPIPKEFLELFLSMHINDSAVLLHSGDSILKYFPNAQGQILPTDKIYTYFYIKNMFTDSLSAANADKLEKEKYRTIDSIQTIEDAKKAKELAALQIGVDEKKLQSYFLTNKLKPIKIPGSISYKIDKVLGDKKTYLKPNQTALVYYTGRTLAGEEFDSNTNPKSQHKEALKVQYEGGMINGFLAGVKTIAMGGKATVYIPSTEGYGARGSGAIKANEILIFDLEVRNIVSSSAATPKEPIKRTVPIPKTPIKKKVIAKKK